MSAASDKRAAKRIGDLGPASIRGHQGEWASELPRAARAAGVLAAPDDVRVSIYYFSRSLMRGEDRADGSAERDARSATPREPPENNS